jgi:pimeloyl-ACP methyl ester carboxylesterase
MSHPARIDRAMPAARPAGGGRVPLVLVPGTLCDGRVYDPVMALLPPRETILRLPIGHETAPDMAKALLARLPPRFALAGFSLGGIVALEMIAREPHRFAGLALIDTTPNPDPEPNWTRRRNAVARAAKVGLDRYVSDKIWSAGVADATRETNAHRQLLTDMSVALGIDTFRQQSEIAIHRADSRPRLAAIGVPTLVLCGEDDQLCLAETHRQMAAAIPRAQLALIPQAGHFALIEQPAAAARAFDAWLTDVDGHYEKEIAR